MKLILLSIAALASAAAQTFEVATIKPSPPPGPTKTVGWFGGPGTADPTTYRCQNCTPETMICLAFHLDRHQYSGPAWTQDTDFELSAKIPEGATQAQFEEMFRNFLIERFQLKFHWEKKQMHGYELVVAKGGPKLVEAPANAPSADADDEKPAAKPDFNKKDADGFPALPPGRQFMMMAAHGLSVLRCASATMESLVDQLAGQLSEPVTDATGLKGKYDFTLKWSNLDPAAAVDSKPTLFKAVQDQLGLKLEPRKTTIDLFVVDHLEKTPIAN